MNEKTFQAVVKYGTVALALCLILNIWVVMRHVEVYRDATRAMVQFQQLATQQQIFQGLLQEFAARASTDTQIAEIFKQAQAMATAPTGVAPSGTAPAGAIPAQPNPPTEPMR
jgi:hypothetical protein